jgi:pectate lyase
MSTKRPPVPRTGIRRKALVLGGAAAAVVLAIGGTQLAFAATSLFSDSFDSGSTSNWSKSGGTWAIANDGGNVLQQSDATSENAREFAGDTSWTDFSMQARVKPLSFGSGGLAGIDARVQSATKFYRLALSSGQAQLQAVSGSTVTVLGTTTQTISTGTWYTLNITVAGSTVSGSLNGTQFASATNTSYATGRIGLQTVYASASFDDVTVTSSASGGTTSSSPTTTASATASPTASSASPTASSTGGGSSSTVHGYATVSGSTTGGGSGPSVTVTSLAALETEAASSTAETILVNGLFSGSGNVTVASNKSIIGVGANSGLTGIGLSMKGVSNVIIRNLNISKVTAASGTGDAIHIESGANHIWIDHNNLFSDQNNGKDYYDGLIDITHAADYVTVSWNYLHDHYKASLVGHSDSNGSEDTGHLHVTYDHNYWYNINSRTPSLRFGTGHVYDNYFANGDTGVHSRENAQMLVENNVFRSVSTPIETTGDSDVDGYVNQSGNDIGTGTNNITQTGTFTTAPYAYTLDATSGVIASVTAGVGTGKIG